MNTKTRNECDGQNSFNIPVVNLVFCCVMFKDLR